MLMLREAPADTVAPPRESGGYVGHESSSVRALTVDFADQRRWRCWS